MASPNELVIIHPGGLSVACWSRVASLLPAGTAVRVHELEQYNPFWHADPNLTVAMLAARLRVGPGALLVGWGVGGAVADALAARVNARRVVIFDGLAPGAPEPDDAELRRRFAMYLGARRDVPVRAGGDLETIVAAATEAGALPAAASVASVRRSWEEHVRRERRDHRLMAGHTPSGGPLTVVKATRSLDPASPALGWDRFGPVEVLRGGGDHYSMLTNRGTAAQLAMLLARWLAPAYAAA